VREVNADNYGIECREGASNGGGFLIPTLLS